MKVIYTAFILCIIFTLPFSCNKQKKKIKEIATRDTTITKENSYTELFLDTTSQVHFYLKQQTPDSIQANMQSFYNQRNHQFAWFFPDGMSDLVATFLSLQNDYIHLSGDSTLLNPQLTHLVSTLEGKKRINPLDSLVIETELLLTQQFFKYASVAYIGSQHINTQELSWFIPRKKIDTNAFLDSLIKNKGQNIDRYEPVNKKFNSLKASLLHYYELQKMKAWPQLILDKQAKAGKASPALIPIKKRLMLLHDFPNSDSLTDAYDSTLITAVKCFQKRMGLKVDGEIGAAFMGELNIPIEARIEQILINLERLRWVPESPSTDYLLVNIPEFKLHAYEAGKHAFDMAVVVGSEVHNTVIFSGSLNQIVFSPYWNVPNSILVNEILPGIKRNPHYLAKHNMEWNGKTVRQKPGKSNSLGQVKFLFPNNYSIYLHDTPSKRLFSESARAFSHGCIRVAEPQKLAQYLLRNDSTWTTQKIDSAMEAGKEKYVLLKGKSEIPVFIVYFTAWTDLEGKLNFRKDIYGHDQKMKERLFN